MKHWSVLQREICRIVDDSIDFQIHLTRYRMCSQYGSTDLPRYWITLGDEVIFDDPKQFVVQDESGSYVKNLKGERAHDPYENDISDISALLREYLDTPKEALLAKQFANDCRGIVNILKAADRRFGRRRLELLKRKTGNQAAQKVIACRLRGGIRR